MLRREVLTLIGGTVAAWSLAAGAQQKAMPVIGYLSPGSPESDVFRLTGFRQGLIGIGGHLAVPPLPHHRAYGSRTRRFE
jgi:putative ABC transport system substrate-binding protein